MPGELGWKEEKDLTGLTLPINVGFKEISVSKGSVPLVSREGEAKDGQAALGKGGAAAEEGGGNAFESEGKGRFGGVPGKRQSDLDTRAQDQSLCLVCAHCCTLIH